MTVTLANLAFDLPDLGAILNVMHTDELDELEFGVIGFDAAGIVHTYNRFESTATGIPPSRVIGRPLFTEVAPCMNNFMVSQRFVDAAFTGAVLDVTIDYVLTLRMKPTCVKLRLADALVDSTTYVLVQRAHPR